MSNQLFRHYQTRQRALAKSTLPQADFEAALHALVAELRQHCREIDSLSRDYLCQELGTQLQRELVHAPSARHRHVLLALLKAIERIQFQSPVR